MIQVLVASSYMNLFVAAMLMLVLGDNLVVLYLGWEGVGLCSYLLIGFCTQNQRMDMLLGRHSLSPEWVTPQWLLVCSHYLHN